MYIEACFGLIAISLPSLSGAFKLKGVQTMVAGFTDMLSNLSLSSGRSRQAGIEEPNGGKGGPDNVSHPSESEGGSVREVEQWRPSNVVSDIEMEVMRGDGEGYERTRHDVGVAR